MNQSKTGEGISSIIVSSSNIIIPKTDLRNPSITESNIEIKISKTDLRKRSITKSNSLSKTDQRINSITDSNSDIKTKETWGWKLVELSADQQWERLNVLLISIAMLLIFNASLLLYYFLYYFMLSSPKTILVDRTIFRREIVGKKTLLFVVIILAVRSSCILISTHISNHLHSFQNSTPTPWLTLLLDLEKIVLSKLL
jgi:hypothetical protein